MNDKRLLTLARLADEAERFEAEAFASAAAAPAVRGGRAGGTGVLARIGGPILALAASVAVVAGVVIFWPAGAAPSGAPLAGGTAPIDPAPGAATEPGFDVLAFAAGLFSSEMRFDGESGARRAAGAGDAHDESLVVAIVQDPHGEVQCVSWSREHPDAGEGLAPTELARRVCRPDCVDGPHWLVAAKVTGPRQAMPSGEAEMRELARCILAERHDRCDAGPSTIAADSSLCMPTGLRVTVERRSMARGR